MITNFMKQKINIDFLKTIIETDFLLISVRLRKNLRYLKAKVSLKSYKETTFSLEIFELIKSIKQLLRILYFFKKQTKKTLHICTSNTQLVDFLKSYLEAQPSNLPISVQETFSRIKGGPNQTRALLFFEDSLGKGDKILKKLFEENILIVNSINSKLEVNNYGTYKMYTDISDFKKLIFLLILIYQATL